jgi:hypothetical protein
VTFSHIAILAVHARAETDAKAQLRAFERAAALLAAASAAATPVGQLTQASAGWDVETARPCNFPLPE